MAQPKKGYWLDGERLPSVTTVLSRFKDSGALIYWAWNEGREGRDFRETRDQAANAGTAVHEMVQSWKSKQPFDRTKYTPEVIERARGAYEAFLEWAKQTKLEIQQNEVTLISKKHRFGGTLDATLVQGKLSLADWKSSNGVYPDYVIQLAAYGILWEENFPEQPLLGGFHLLRFSKAETPDDAVSFAHHFWSDLELAKKQFLLLREAYSLDARIKKMV